MFQVILLIAGVAAFFAAMGHVNRRADRLALQSPEPELRAQVPQKVR